MTDEEWQQFARRLRERDAEIERLIVAKDQWAQAADVEAKERRAAHAEIERLRAMLPMQTIGHLIKENERLRAAIAWTREVRPGKNAESGGAIVHMTWDQFNAMRALAEPKP